MVSRVPRDLHLDVLLLLRVQELLIEIAALGLALEVCHQRGGDLGVGLLEGETFAYAGGDALATGGEIFFERLGVARELTAQVFDLFAQIARGAFFSGSACLVLAQALLAQLHGRERAAESLEVRAQVRAARPLGRVGLGARRFG